MTNVVEALPIKAQLSLLFILLFLRFVLFWISVVNRFSNKLGVLALMYSSIGCLMSYLRDEDDNIVSVGAAAVTGAVLSSGSPQARALTVAGTTVGLSAMNYLDAVQRENSARSYARRGRLQALGQRAQAAAM